MSPVRPFGGESLQEMIDRYNRELMEMGGAGTHRPDGDRSGQEKLPSTQTDRPTQQGGREGAADRDGRTARPEPFEPLYGREQRQPRPEPDEPLYRPGERMPRPEPDEPLDEPRTHGAMREYRQGIEDIRQGQRDREQGERDMRQAQLDREQGMRDFQQGQKDRAQGMRDRQQAQRDREQGEKDMTHARADLMRGLEELREGLRELERLQREYLAELPAWEHRRAVHSSDNDAFDQEAVMTAADPDAQREQWLRDLEQGRRELEQGLRDLEEGLREREQGVREYEQGLAEREYWLNQSRQASAPVQTGEPSAYPPARQEQDAPMHRRNPDGTIPTEPAVPGRVTAQSQPGEQPSGDGVGTLIVQAYTARRAEPVAGAQVVITRPSDSGEVLYRITGTDIDGRTPPLQLPVRREDDGGASYAVYKVYVTADKYQPSGALSAQIFPGITGILPVELIPGEGVGF